MLARRITSRHRLALISSLSGLFLAGIQMAGMDYSLWLPKDSFNWHEELRHAYAVAHVFTWTTPISFLLAAAIPLLILLARPRVREIDATTIRRADVTGLSVAPDGRGVSVAVATKSGTSFFEVDTLDDARSLASAAGQAFPAAGEIALDVPRQSPFLAVGMFSFVALVYAAMVPLYADILHGMGVLWAGGAMVSVGLLALIVLRFRQSRRISWSADTQLAGGIGRELDRSPLERHIRRHLEARLKEAPAAPRVRVDLFERKDDTTAAWLGRIDTLRQASGYRGESAPSELLFETVKDAMAPIDVRLGAARLLRIRDQESPARIAEGITDDEVRIRVAAVMKESTEEAAVSLDAIGPLFRARE